MSSIVTVTFAADRVYEIPVHDAAALFDADGARRWLDDEFVALECTPTNPLGKVLLLDKILNVARYGGEARFAHPGPWVERFAAATALLLDRPAILVDVAGFKVG